MTSLPVLSVKELTRYLKESMEADPILQAVWVRGEISNYKCHTSGHLYFTLKDETSQIRAVMFRSRTQLLNFQPANGMKVLAFGQVTVYERDGQYQLYVNEMQPDGLGSLHMAFLQLKERLEKEGLFDPARKKAIPTLPRRVGIVTSPTGAALRDLVSVITRRCPKIHLLIAPALVQGEGAPPTIVRGIELLNREKVDVIIVARGGGSLEELWAFNDERVARAIFASDVPIISAVGHQTDFTIADFVADLRAPTPSAAGELVVPDWRELSAGLTSLKGRLLNAMTQKVSRERKLLTRVMDRYVFRFPKQRIFGYQQTLDFLTKSLHQNTVKMLTAREKQLAALAGKLDALSPLAILSRGYSLTLRAIDGEVVRRAAELQPGDLLCIRFADGEAISWVEKTKIALPEDEKGGNR